jgi:hypothetical protein
MYIRGIRLYQVLARLQEFVTQLTVWHSLAVIQVRSTVARKAPVRILLGSINFVATGPAFGTIRTPTCMPTDLRDLAPAKAGVRPRSDKSDGTPPANEGICAAPFWFLR